MFCQYFNLSDEDCSSRFDEIKNKSTKSVANNNQNARGILMLKDNDRNIDDISDILPLLLFQLIGKRNNVVPADVTELPRSTIIWNDCENDALFFSKNKNGKQIKNILKGKLFQTSLETGDSNGWDLTILGTILLSIPFKTEKTECHIQALKEIRNKMAHMPDMDVSDELFNELFGIISQSMVSIGYDESVLNSLKNTSSNQSKKKLFIDENCELKNMVAQADEEFDRKKYFEAIKLYSDAINLFDLSNDELADLFFKRSLVRAQLYNGSSKPDDKYLYRALLDAEKVVANQPQMTRGYIQNAELSFKLNLLKNSEELYNKALAIDLGNEELKNSLAFVRYKKGEQDRLEHLDPNHNLLTSEEKHEHFLHQLNLQNENQRVTIHLNEFRKHLLEFDSSKADVFLGHDYRDGSKSIKQNYEMAAKYYGKAAQKNNAEALYSLALLHMKGQGVKIYFPKAICMLKKAAAQPNTETDGYAILDTIGVKDSAHALGLAYEQGTYVEKNMSVAVSWYEAWNTVAHFQLII